MQSDDRLHKKYHVVRLNDDAGKHDKCGYFVLDPYHDPIARIAMSSYVTAARAQGLYALANDLEEWLSNLDNLERL